MTARTRPFNFSAGPAMLPEEVLREAAAEMLDWHGSGMGVMEMSHRGREFIEIYETAERNLRALLAVPPEFRILFMQGGGLGENAIVPMNLSRGGLVDVIVTGAWSKKSLGEAGRYANACAAASNEASGFTTLPAPASWELREGASYLHLCSNETIHGVEFQTLPDLAALGSSAPLVVDCSSHVLSRSIDWSRVGLAFAGAQKNIGPAGLTIVFVREDLLGHALPICPTAFDYTVVAEHGSMFNTPPTYGIYIAGLVFQHVLRQGGVAEMERRAIERSQLLYRYLDDNGGFYRNPVAADARSRMNVPFFLADASHNEAFLAGAREAGLLQLKGHKSVGGMRASLYNAMPLAGVQTLVEYMKDFVRRHG
ncbi:3-phosphoserine/phosphohydroxythreonine transaminase [Ideonella azotifigens]|uniref:Phosphoserine aminotransferase n=1 Tax=Ideonella azotifigens TaxID=513160 RepID=A0ABN1JXY1_9BURK|nr:3-phosphoserine/phosphohydroxythreonine transaminase [Ideonella azotifigens]MCD2341380.1 3-phosphoserine/phosphohydroxythreonine transaminase [Ideonella azotifigens]